ncbi:MAG TPA: tetratricopeptide repeat protein [Longimicrobium sp.]|nr:tetratricopeptide repeat protein [Longimicrobium sp.]
MTTLFISHSPHDDDFVRELRAQLELHGLPGWIASRGVRGGDPLWPEVQEAIEGASGCLVVVSPASLQSSGVGRELRHALKVREARGRERYPVVPLALDGTRLGVLEEFFGEAPAYVPVSGAAGGVEAAVHAVLVALGRRLPDDVAAAPQPGPEPLEELILELTDLKLHEREGVRRASARARLVHQPATPGRPEVVSARTWRLTAPLGPIEAGELRWYLEKYATWPGDYFRDRARKVEESLVAWGRLLHDAAMPAEHTANVLQAWARIGDDADRRFSVHVDAEVEAGAPEADAAAAREAATALLALPWELLHDGRGFLFQGAKPTRVRRRLPNESVLDVPVVDPPIRILLVTARPEDDTCGYIDHRASALPLVEAMEALPGLVRIHVLSPPTLPALREELDRARHAREPYHVVHFDGHGVYDRRAGLGGLCFEAPEDAGKLEERRHAKVFTDTLGPLLRDHRVPLVFLEACHTAQAGQASESVAAALLGAGVASVVAMTHSVLVETARRFVEAFYDALARGGRVGDAMLEGQRRLKDDPSRGRVFGAGELRLEDWFVPVLFQERDDPRLFRTTPSRQTREDFLTRLRARLGALPPEPETGFVGRSRELLGLQRLLRPGRWAVVRGQGGEGKTALAAELARWMVRSYQVERAAFVSVETHGHAAAVLDALGRQLVPGYSVAMFEGPEEALLPVERALRERPTLLVVDNMESVLLPPFVAAETPDAFAEDARRELDAILALCARLGAAGETRLLFTSREALPAPFDAARHRLELHRLGREDAVKLVERTLNAGGAGASADAAREAIEALVEAVAGHARTLALLAPALRERGVEATRAALVELMEEMERAFPGSREKSVFASVELSLRRLSPENRERARVLAAFHGGAGLDVLRAMTGWEAAEVAALAAGLAESGLATPHRYGHLTLNPALCPYLRGRTDPAEREALGGRWSGAMREYAGFLVRQRSRNAELAATLTVLELPNLLAMLDAVRRAGDAEATIGVATSLHSLLEGLGRPGLLEHVAQVRDSAEAALGAAWSHARFEAQRTRIEAQLLDGRVREALEGAERWLQRALAAGETAYPDADYDLAVARFVSGRVLRAAGAAERALPLVDEAREGFEAVERDRPGRGAGEMATACFAERGACLLALGRPDEAATAYEESIRRAEERGNVRQVAVGKGQLGAVRMEQNRHPEALEAYEDARERFTKLNEPRIVAGCWNQTGLVHQKAGRPEAAEDAYRSSLAISVRLGDVAGQARTLGNLGMLYDRALGRTEEAVAFLRQSVDRYAEIGDVAAEGRNRSNLALRLHKLGRLDEAREEIRRAIECGARFGHASEPWKSFAILARIETDAGNPAAAADAGREATERYLAYRRAGGENHGASGRLCLALARSLLSGDPAGADALLQPHATRATSAGGAALVDALQAIVAGRRDRALAEAPGLDYEASAEILLLLEALERLP